MLAQSFSSDNSSQGNTYKGLPYWQSPCCMFLLHDWEQQHHIPLKKNTQRMLAGSDHFSFTLILFVIRFHIRPLFIFWIFWVKSELPRREETLPSTWYLSVCNTKEAPGVWELLAKALEGTHAPLWYCRGDTSVKGTEIWHSGDLVHSYWCLTSSSDQSHLPKQSM